MAAAAAVAAGAVAAAATWARGMPQVRRLTKTEMLFDKLKLNKEQKEEAATILSAAMEKAAPTRDLLNKGRMMIANTITGKGSEDDIKKLLGEYTTVSATMTSIEAEAFGKLYALLKPNQQAKAPQAFELMAGMFAGGGMPAAERARRQGRGETIDADSDSVGRTPGVHAGVCPARRWRRWAVGGGGGGMPSGGFGPATRLDRMSEALKLSKDQKKDVKAAMDDAQKEATPIHEQMTKSQLAIAEAIAAGKSKEEVDKAIHSEADLETQMVVDRIAYLREGGRFPGSGPETARRTDRVRHGAWRVQRQELELRPIGQAHNHSTG